jgi:hypothetical protein
MASTYLEEVLLVPGLGDLGRITGGGGVSSVRGAIALFEVGAVIP